MRISPYRTLEDKIEGLVVTIIDITAQTQAEKEVKVVYNELESRVKTRTDELSRSNLALRGEIEDKSRSEESRHLLLEDLVRAQEEERRRLARDLHDHLGQRLTTLRMRIESMKDSKARTPATPDELQEIVKRLDADVDFLAWELRPIALDELGLESALSNYAHDSGRNTLMPRQSFMPEDWTTSGCPRKLKVIFIESRRRRLTIAPSMQSARAPILFLSGATTTLS